MLMADAKKKRVLYRVDDPLLGSPVEQTFESIDEACEGLGTYRKKVYRCVKENIPFCGGHLSYVDDTL
jgi:hypothetical protein